MSVKIYDIEKKCKCAKKGIKPGYELVSINGNEINDVLDYRFYSDEEKLVLNFRNEKGRYRKVKIKHNDGCDSLGLSFETYLMDKHKHCKNACIFCFIDQLPKGLRESLYFKDDDSRLSFLFGNYITLTNLTEADVERIIKMHISPINASVHTMDPELRVKMMKNPNAGKSLQYLKRFSDAGISINAQLVLCPGINDGDALKYSLTELSKLPSVNSIAAVPVGLTKYRDGLYPLTAFTEKTASDVIDIIDNFNLKLSESNREKLAYPSDEFFQIANRSIPDYEYYCDFPQLDNGVGLYASLKKEFLDALNDCEADAEIRDISIATGVAAFPLLKMLADEFSVRFQNSRISVFCIENEFFGDTVTVAGLITGKDLINSLKKQNFACKNLLLPSVMFKSRNELIFLDDTTVSDVEEQLNTRVTITDCDGGSLFDIFCEMK
ncbi:MAG: DUF512 domain-containing protein [Clostridia bacterium]|nr:DUF512 domain-containing protein [Clostridia bacterium]